MLWASLSNYLIPRHVLVTTEKNIALGKPAFMSSQYGSGNQASNGNDGDKTTHFHTGRGNEAWWGVDFGVERARVTGVHLTNGGQGKYYLLLGYM